MSFDLATAIVDAVLRGWHSGKVVIRAVIILMLLSTTSFLILLVLRENGYVDKDVAKRLVFGLIGLTLSFLGIVIGYVQHAEIQEREAKIEAVAEQVRAHPERPQLAWDLARTKLESYLDRNLSQVRSIYWLTLLVMLSGFSLIAFGIYHAIQDAAKLPISVVSSASGVLISFIGGSFLIIYRSILSQSKGYVSVLERINAVGMAVQVISNIPDSDIELKNQTTAELAKQLLQLYAPPRSGARAGES